MSGGSYNYLYNQEVREIVDSLGTIERMASTLKELGHEDAAEETLALKYIIEQSIVKIKIHQEGLKDVWKAVEWYESADWSIDEVNKAIAKYRGEVVGNE